MSVLIVRTTSAQQTETLGIITAKNLGNCRFVALYGGLGAGKTTFVRGVAHGLGFSGAVTSPTYAIVNNYECASNIFHFDFYRLHSVSELYDIGWDDYLESGGICIAEWCENIAEVVPEDAVTLEFAAEDDGVRTIRISFPFELSRETEREFYENFGR